MRYSLTSHLFPLTSFHRLLNLLDGRDSLIVNFIHITLRIAGCIALELTLVESAHKLTDGRLLDLALGKTLTDIVVRELLDRDVEFVAHISPEGSQHLVVELAGLVVGHQTGSLLESLGSHLVGLLATLFDDIRILDGPLTEDNEERDKDQCQHGERYPIASGTEEEIIEGMLTGVARLDIPDVLAQELEILLTGEVADTGRTGALLHLEREAFRLGRLVLMGGRIIIGELDRRYLVLALMTGHGEDIVDHRALQTIGRQLGLIGDLGVILVKIFGELHNRLLDELEIARTTDDDTQRDRVVGLGHGLVELCRDRELPHSTREIGRTSRQRVNLNLNARCYDLLLHLHIAGTTIEERLERIDVTILLDNNTIKGDAGYLHLARHLRKHDVLAPGTGAIGPSVDRLKLETLLLGQWHLLGVEALQVGHITTQLCQRHERIYLISQQDRLLFVDTPFVGTDLDEKI